MHLTTIILRVAPRTGPTNRLLLLSRPVGDLSITRRDTLSGVLDTLYRRKLTVIVDDRSLGRALHRTRQT